MATELIPQKKIMVCDRCGKKDDPPFRKEASVSYRQHQLDCLGNRACIQEHKYDLCDQCALHVIGAIEISMKKDGSAQ